MNRTPVHIRFKGRLVLSGANRFLRVVNDQSCLTRDQLILEDCLTGYVHIQQLRIKGLCFTLEQELTPFDFETEMERSNCVI